MSGPTTMRRFGFGGLLGLLASTSSAMSDAPMPPVESMEGITHHETNRLAYSLPFANLDMAQMRAFVLGNRTFNLRWAIAPASAEDVDGLGPTFAQHSCSSCHLRDGRSRLPQANGEAIAQAVIKLSPKRARDRDWLLAQFGGELQAQAVAGVPREASAQVLWVDSHRVSVGPRQIELQRPTVQLADALDPGLHKRVDPDILVAPAVFGLGLIENIDAATILEYEDPEDRDHDGISGRAHRVNGAQDATLGRFGWKATATTLREQITTAAFADMGLTSAEHPDENCPTAQRRCRDAPRGNTVDLTERAVQALESYLRLLAVPAPRSPSPQFARGREMFREFQCERCHRETLHTGAGSAIALLNHQTIHPYSDFLLHDLGEALADHRHAGAAAPNEWRTPPLWGLGLQTTVNGHLRLLHDGRAEGFEQAILWHGGEAEQSRERYRSASDQERGELLEFLGAL